MINGPFKTGNEPTAIAIDPRGIYIYLTNSLDSTVSAYAISLPTGTPSTIVGAARPAATPRTPTRWRSSSIRRSAALSIRPTIWAIPSPASASIPIPAH